MNLTKYSISFKILVNLLIGYILEETELIDEKEARKLISTNSN